VVICELTYSIFEVEEVVLKEVKTTPLPTFGSVSLRGSIKANPKGIWALIFISMLQTYLVVDEILEGTKNVDPLGGTMK